MNKQTEAWLKELRRERDRLFTVIAAMRANPQIAEEMKKGAETFKPEFRDEFIKWIDEQTKQIL